MSSFGGGGTACTICEKTVYPAETVQFEKKPYHIECFKCVECNKKMEGAGKAAGYEGKLYCHGCFKKGGFAQMQRNVKWEKKESSGSAIASKFGGGGTSCTECAKTVYPAETVQFEKKPYHPGCFKCKNCSNKLTPSGAAQFDDDVYCTKCFKDLGLNRKQTQQASKSTGGGAAVSAKFSKFGGGGTKCTICAKTVYPAETIQYEKKPYHQGCFKCSHCAKKMSPSGAAQFEDTLFCSKCFKDLNLNRKQTQTIKKEGGTTAASAKFSKFGGGGNKCKKCDKTVYPAETLQFEKMYYHQKCFVCDGCDKKLTPSAAEWHKENQSVHCKKCFLEKGLNRA